MAVGGVARTRALLRTNPEFVAVAGLTLAAAAIRFSTLGTQSYDELETYTVGLMQMSFSKMLSTLPSWEGTPPLYYVLTWPVAKAAGTGEATLRSISALASTATVPVVYVAARNVASKRAGLLAAALLTVSPAAVWYAQYARAYALGQLLVAVSMLFFLREVSGRGETRHNLAGWAVASGLAVATHYFTALVVAPEALWLVLRSPRRRTALIATAVPVAVLAAFLPLISRQEPNTGAGESAEGSLALRLIRVPKQVVVGGNLPAETLIAVTAAVLVALGAWLALTRAREEDRRAARAGLALTACAIGGLFALALVGPDYFLARYVTFALPPAALALGAGFASTRIGVAAAAGLAAVFAAAVIAVDVDPLAQRPDYRGSLGGLAPPPPGGRAVVISTIPAHLEVFLPAAREMPPLGRPVREVVVVGLAVVAGKTRRHPRAATALIPREFRVAGAKRTSSYVRVTLRASRAVPVRGFTVFQARRLGLSPVAILYQPPRA